MIIDDDDNDDDDDDDNDEHEADSNREGTENDEELARQLQVCLCVWMLFCQMSSVFLFLFALFWKKFFG